MLISFCFQSNETISKQNPANLYFDLDNCTGVIGVGGKILFLEKKHHPFQVTAVRE